MEPSDILRNRIAEHLRETKSPITLISTRTGIGYYRLRRWIQGGMSGSADGTDRIAHDDAVKLEQYLSGQ